MKASHRAKQLGTTVTAMARCYGCTTANLRVKFRVKPFQFDVIAMGTAAITKQETNK